MKLLFVVSLVCLVGCDVDWQGRPEKTTDPVYLAAWTSIQCELPPTPYRRDPEPLNRISGQLRAHYAYGSAPDGWIEPPDLFEGHWVGTCEDAAFWSYVRCLEAGYYARWCRGALNGLSHAWCQVWVGDHILILDQGGMFWTDQARGYVITDSWFGASHFTHRPRL